MNVSIEIQGDKELISAFESIEDGLKDLRKGKTWQRVRQAFYRIQKEQFGSEGGTGASGKWKPLTPKYAKVKQRKYGNKPINQATGRLYKSLTQAGGESTFEEQATTMTIGSNTPYAGYVQKARPIIDLTPDQEKKLLEPVERYVRQLAANVKLKSI